VHRNGASSSSSDGATAQRNGASCIKFENAKDF